ncbi:MAG: NUDIX hydrolase [Gordonia sp. (in: high G+C Gram-positive bacteria)]|uniref:NUDIX hydrolase n=1 Tax=Gordonia sp. (in: high G+C Gram-positive bacteria) TaxID=84139 RepID=UPI0039E63711
MRGDGDGWVFDPDGARYWGRFGAAGLLVCTRMDDGGIGVLLQHRAVWSHQGGTWGLPGGARDSHESAVDAAVREANEEAGLDRAQLEVLEDSVTHEAVSGWTYTTVIARVPEPVATTANGESVELRWVPEAQVDDLPLHPGFGRAWPELRRRLR